MSYTLNSAKDSKGNEDLYMELFNRELPQIQQYKSQHGGDLEGAFGAINGTPWPSGRSVKLSHGVPEMTKDRTIGSVLGKFVAAPAAIAATAMFAPGALPAIGHALAGAAMHGGIASLATRAGMGAGQSLLQGGGWKGALTGAGIGAVTPGLGSGGASGAASGGIQDFLKQAGVGAAKGLVQGGPKGALFGAASGAASQIPGNAGKMLNGFLQSQAPQPGNGMFGPPALPQTGSAPLSGDFGVPAFNPTARPQGW